MKLKHVTADLDAFLQGHPSMPTIDDPGCPGETYNHRWGQEEYSNYRNWIHTYAEWIADAHDEPDREESIRKWRRILGTEFASLAMTAEKASRAHLARNDVSDTEQFITEHLGFPLALTSGYSVSLRARTDRRKGFRHYDLAFRGNVVGRQRKIRFDLRTNTVPEPFEIYWKVRNSGAEALDANCIRGQIVADNGTRQRVEPTAYAGRHYVEVYVVKDRCVVAMDHQEVIVR